MRNTKTESLLTLHGRVKLEMLFNGIASCTFYLPNDLEIIFDHGWIYMGSLICSTLRHRHFANLQR